MLPFLDSFTWISSHLKWNKVQGLALWFYNTGLCNDSCSPLCSPCKKINNIQIFHIRAKQSNKIGKKGSHHLLLSGCTWWFLTTEPLWKLEKEINFRTLTIVRIILSRCALYFKCCLLFWSICLIFCKIFYLQIKVIERTTGSLN